MYNKKICKILLAVMKISNYLLFIFIFDNLFSKGSEPKEAKSIFLKIQLFLTHRFDDQFSIIQTYVHNII